MSTSQPSSNGFWLVILSDVWSAVVVKEMDGAVVWALQIYLTFQTIHYLPVQQGIEAAVESQQIK